MSKTQQVLEHLKEHGSITKWEAFTEYHATRLSSIIFNLRKYGYKIDSLWIRESKPNYVKYVLKGEK